MADISNAPGLTRRIADYAVAAAATPLPEGVVEKAKHHVLDTIAAMVSGAALPPGRLARPDTNDPIHSTLNEAWRTFWANPAEYHGWEAKAVEELFSLCARDPIQR